MLKLTSDNTLKHGIFVNSPASFLIDSPWSLFSPQWTLWLSS